MTSYAAILAAIAALGDIPPLSRIIVGFPMVGENEVVERGHLTLMGHTAFEKLKAYAVPLDLKRDPFLILSGIEIETFGDRPDHAQLLSEILHELTTPHHEESDNA